MPYVGNHGSTDGVDLMCACVQPVPLLSGWIIEYNDDMWSLLPLVNMSSCACVAEKATQSGDDQTSWMLNHSGDDQTLWMIK